MIKIIEVAEFRTRNIKDNPLKKVYLEHIGFKYYYINFDEYKSLIEAKKDIKDMFGIWHDFKLLV